MTGYQAHYKCRKSVPTIITIVVFVVATANAVMVTPVTNCSSLALLWQRGMTYTKAGGRTGTGSPPCTRRREVPTRVWKALLKALLPTRGLPKVMHRMSAWGYCSAAHVAPAQHHHSLTQAVQNLLYNMSRSQTHLETHRLCLTMTITTDPTATTLSTRHHPSAECCCSGISCDNMASDAEGNGIASDPCTGQH